MQQENVLIWFEDEGKKDEILRQYRRLAKYYIRRWKGNPTQWKTTT